MKVSDFILLHIAAIENVMPLGKDELNRRYLLSIIRFNNAGQ
jgi:hypothetical protein